MVHGVTYKEDNFDNTEQLKGIWWGTGGSAAHYFNYLDD